MAFLIHYHLKDTNNANISIENELKYAHNGGVLSINIAIIKPAPKNIQHKNKNFIITLPKLGRIKRLHIHKIGYINKNVMVNNHSIK